MDPRYPIGTSEEALAKPLDYETARAEIAAFPQRLRERLRALTDQQLRAQYRPGSWNVRQLVHHCADSHMHALLRTKRALTEPEARIHGYLQAPTATLPDYTLPVEPSLLILDGVHAHFAALLAALTSEQCDRGYFHAENQRAYRIPEIAALYAWHGRHHLAHIELALRETK